MYLALLEDLPLKHSVEIEVRWLCRLPITLLIVVDHDCAGEQDLSILGRIMASIPCIRIAFFSVIAVSWTFAD